MMSEGMAEHHDETDVEACLARTTFDGPGDLENLPESDFDGFPEEGVETEETKK